MHSRIIFHKFYRLQTFLDPLRCCQLVPFMLFKETEVDVSSCYGHISPNQCYLISIIEQVTKPIIKLVLNQQILFVFPKEIESLNHPRCAFTRPVPYLYSKNYRKTGK